LGRSGLSFTVDLVVGEDEGVFNRKLTCNVNGEGVEFTVERFEDLKHVPVGAAYFPLSATPDMAARVIDSTVGSKAIRY